MINEKFSPESVKEIKDLTDELKNEKTKELVVLFFAVIIESVDSGTATAVVAADIYDYYFSTKNQISSSQQTNQLLR